MSLKNKKNIKMKITKRQLRRIIKEEKQNLLREGQAQAEGLYDALDQYVTAIDEEMGYNVPLEQLKAEVLNFVDGYFEQAAQSYKGAEHEGVYEGTSPNDMPSSWKQILKDCLKDK